VTVRFAVIAAVVLCWPTSAPATDAGPQAAETSAEDFARATNLVGDERFAEAADALLALATRDPEGAFADDALFTAAQLFEQELGDPTRALDTYRTLLDRYPDSRVALAAARRSDALEAEIGAGGGGDRALARFNEILMGYPDRPVADSIAAAEALLQEYPDWSGAPRATLSLAGAHQRQDTLDRANDLLESISTKWPDSHEAFDALRSAGEIALKNRDYERAQALFGELRPQDEDEQRVAAEALTLLGRERLRHKFYLVAYGLLAAILIGLFVALVLSAGSVRNTLGSVLRPPGELLYLLPIAVLLVAAAYTGHEQIGPAVAIICGGGLIVTWLSGAGLEAAAKRGGIGRGRAWSHAGATAVAVMALCYIAVHRTGLIDLIVSTVRFGPDV
jgi:tetratricopeptide (TPR) repeat protein